MTQRAIPTAARAAHESGRSPRRKLLFVDSIADWGGGQKWCLETAAALSARGHQVHLAVERGGSLARRARAAGLFVRELRLSRAGGGPAGWALRRECRAAGIECIVANVGRDVRAGALAASACSARLVQRRGIERPLKRDPFSRWLYRRLVACVVANCEAIRAGLSAEECGFPAQRCRVIPNAVNVPENPTGDGRRLRRALGLGDGPVAACISRLAPMKGHGVLLEAWRSVVRRRPDARLLIVGTGVLESALRRQVEMASMSTSVHFAGFVPDLQDWFAAMDVLVLASVRDEGCNNTLLETMARGRPAVVTRCGGLPEQVESGQSGWIVQPDDPAALAEALTESLTNPDERARRGARALELARERYAPERVLASWESLFEELLAPGAGLSR